MSEEEIIYFLKILEVLLIASVKLVLAPFEAERYGFNFRDAFLITTSGGLTGILAFTFIGQGIAYGWKKIKGLFQSKEKILGKTRKKFTISNKMTVRIKMRFGLVGVALITPSLISIPVGTLVINHLYKKKLKNIITLTLSVVFWSMILNTVAQYLKLSQYLE